MQVGAASGAAPPEGQHTIQDLAEATFNELMAKVHGSAGRHEGSESSEICPRGDLRLLPPSAPASDESVGQEGTAMVRKEASRPHKEALCTTEALNLSKEAQSPPKEALSPPKRQWPNFP